MLIDGDGLKDDHLTLDLVHAYFTKAKTKKVIQVSRRAERPMCNMSPLEPLWQDKSRYPVICLLPDHEHPLDTYESSRNIAIFRSTFRFGKHYLESALINS